ncbi:MAG: hypothetical protein WDA04_00285 [Anaerolineaceae bacterium]|jgi:hypothetical protein|nr:hypothetical protein [Chloroflexota bacterium]
MSNPIFRYIVVLLGAIVLIRIMLSLSHSMRKDNSNQAGEGPVETLESVNTQKTEDEPAPQVEEIPYQSQREGPEHE